MSRSRRKKRRGFKPKSTDCNLCFFEDTCNQKTAKVCNSFVPADNSLPKAKELRRVVEPLITLAKEDSVANRRLAFARTRNIETVAKLFNELGPRFAQRAGGYTRILKCGFRAGDNAPMAYIELVDRPEVAEAAAE